MGLNQRTGKTCRCPCTCGHNDECAWCIQRGRPFMVRTPARERRRAQPVQPPAFDPVPSFVDYTPDPSPPSEPSYEGGGGDFGGGGGSGEW